MNVSPPPTDPSWFRAFNNLPREHGLEALEVEGALPPELRGTFYKVGPVLMELFGRRYRHWFDGDGGVTAVQLEGGKAHGAVRLLETHGLEAERRAGHAIYAGYGTPMAQWYRRPFPTPKNTANTALMTWQGRLFALWEGGPPTEVDPSTLTALGTSTLGGVVAQTFSAHPHRVASRRASYNFGVRFGRVSALDVFELPDVGPARLLTTVPLGGPPLLHDFVATDHHLVFFIPPARLNVLRLLSGVGTLADSLEWRPDLGTTVMVVPLDDPGHPVQFEVDAFFQWHFANAVSGEADHITVDYIRYPDLETNTWLGSLMTGRPTPTRFGQLHRATLDLKARRMETRALWDGTPEFPRIRPGLEGAPADDVWVGAQSAAAVAALAPQDTIARVNLGTGEAWVGDAGPDRWLGEPIFVPRPGSPRPADGWALVMVYDARAHRSGLAVFDGEDPSRGPVATAWFDHAIPLGFHGVWVG